MPRKKRLHDGSHKIRYTNIYVKNIGDDFTSENLRQEFEKFGIVTSAVVMEDETGKSKGFGFVSFDNHEAAARVKCLCVCVCVCLCEVSVCTCNSYMYNTGWPGVGCTYQTVWAYPLLRWNSFSSIMCVYSKMISASLCLHVPNPD